MPKKLLALLLALVLAVSLLPVSAAAESGTDFVIENGVLKAYNGPGGDVVIPDSVTKPISMAVFEGKTGIEKLTIPGTVTTINASSVSGVPVKEIVIKEGVTSIGDHAFLFSSDIVRMTIPSTVTSIGYCAFEGCNDMDITYGGTMAQWKAIEKGAGQSLHYNDFYKYSTIRCTDGVLHENRPEFQIDEGTLYRYNGPGGVVELPEGIVTTASGVFANNSTITEVTVPGSAKNLMYLSPGNNNGANLFGWCANLEKATMKEGCEVLAAGMFERCPKLATVYLPSTITDIGTAFADCTGLKDIYYNGTEEQWKKVKISPNTVDLINNAIIHYKGDPTTPPQEFVIENGMLVAYNGPGGDVTVPEGVKILGPMVFWNRHDLTKVSLPNSLETIGQDAFADCTSLTGITIPNGVTTISDNAFQNCTALQSITLPKSVTSIGPCVFYGCKGLKTVTFSEGITKISYGMFLGCSSLTSISVPKSLKTWEKESFYNCTSLKDIYYAGTKENWEKMSFASDTAEDIKNCTIHFADTDKFTIDITYDADGGAGTMESVHLFNGDTFVFPECGFTPPAGKVFDAWQMMGMKVQPGTSFKLEMQGDRELVCKALWKNENGTTTSADYFCKQVFDLVNQERAKQGLAPLKGNSLMTEAANVRAKEQAELYSHTRPDGSEFYTAMAEQGIQMGRDFYTAGENIAMGQATAARVMDSWMNSPGHRGNILASNFNFIGIGHYQQGYTHYWVQMFAGSNSLEDDRPFDNISEPTPTPTATPTPAPTHNPGTPTPNPTTPSTPTPTPSPSDPDNSVAGFEDVKPNAWYADAVEYVKEHGLMTGVSDSSFAPNQDTTRGMIITMIHRMDGTPAASGGASFSDVPSNSWYADAVRWASANGLANGSGGKFSPGGKLTRQDFATFMYRYAQYKGYDTTQAANLSKFSDSGAVSGYAREAMQWANAVGLITGTDATHLSPKGTATRAQAAAIFQRFMENVANK